MNATEMVMRFQDAGREDATERITLVDASQVRKKVPPPLISFLTKAPSAKRIAGAVVF